MKKLLYLFVGILAACQPTEEKPVSDTLVDTVAIANGYNNLSSLYKEIGNIDEALFLQLKSNRLRTIFNDSIRLSTSYGNLGDLFNSKNQPDSAEYYAKKSIVLSKKFNQKLKTVFSGLFRHLIVHSFPGPRIKFYMNVFSSCTVCKYMQPYSCIFYICFFFHHLSNCLLNGGAFSWHHHYWLYLTQ